MSLLLRRLAGGPVTFNYEGAINCQSVISAAVSFVGTPPMFVAVQSAVLGSWKFTAAVPAEVAGQSAVIGLWKFTAAPATDINALSGVSGAVSFTAIIQGAIASQSGVEGSYVFDAGGPTVYSYFGEVQCHAGIEVECSGPTVVEPAPVGVGGSAGAGRPRRSTALLTGEEVSAFRPRNVYAPAVDVHAHADVEAAVRFYCDRSYAGLVAARASITADIELTFGILGGIVLNAGEFSREELAEVREILELEELEEVLEIHEILQLLDS